MSKPSTIIKKIRTQLQESTALKYVQDDFVFIGNRENVDICPAIFIEPISEEETEADVNNYQNIRMLVAVTGVIKTNIADFAVVGQGDERGILDIQNDIKIALTSDRTFSGAAIHSWIQGSSFERHDFPIRSVTVNLEIYYRQTSTTRI